jgi:hypothetical protein
MRRSVALVPVAVAIAGAAFGFTTCTRQAVDDRRAQSSTRGCPDVPPTARHLRPHDVRPRRLWTGDMEEGTLSDWSAPGPASEGQAGGGEFNSGSGDAWAGRGHARSGEWAAKLVLSTGRGGTRLFRWRELRAHRDVVVSVWLKLPRRVRLTADRATGRFWNVFQFKSRATSGANDPLWFLNLATPTRRRPRLQLIWWHRTLEGPGRGQRGFRRFTQAVAGVPIGRWFQVTARLRQSSDFDGSLCIWQGSRRLFGKPRVRTSFPNCTYNAWCAANEWSVNHYSDGMSSHPSVLYVDDARVAAW